MRWLAALIALCGIAAAAPAQTIDPARIGRIAENANFAGTILVSRGDTIVYERAFGFVEPGNGGTPHQLDSRWRWASITKQVVATIAMQQVAAGRLDLDAPVSRYWPDFLNINRDSITIRQLMQHVSGLPDPDDSPILPSGLPAFYSADWTDQATAHGYCAGPSLAQPGSAYHYNNCDYIVLGTLLERVSGRTLQQLVDDGIPGNVRFYPDGEPTLPGFSFGVAEPPVRLASYGAAGGLNGTVHDLWRFDRALMTGQLISDTLRAEMWNGNPALGYAALGQWVFPAPLAGCPDRQRLVERRGAIGGVQGRNFIFPDRDITVIAFTNRSEEEFPFGELWQADGFAYDLLSAAACPEPVS